MKYGRDNWTRGIPIENILNHVQIHIAKFKLGNTDEDHIAHAAWGLFALQHFITGCTCHNVRASWDQIDSEYLKEQSA